MPSPQPDGGLPPASSVYPRLEQAARIAGMDVEDLASFADARDPVPVAELVRIGHERGRHTVDEIGIALLDMAMREDPATVPAVLAELEGALRAIPGVAVTPARLLATVRLDHPPHTLARLDEAMAGAADGRDRPSVP